MNRIFYNTIIFATALFVGGVVIVFSIRPSDAPIRLSFQGNDIKWSKITLTAGQSKALEEQINPKETKLSQDTPILVDFGRLSSFLYRAPAGTQSGVLMKNTATGITIGDVSGIVSLYDLFLTYTIFDNDKKFRIEQITNGSFYVGHNAEGKIDIYAIDGVIRLFFLHDGVDMTSMILFPGSHLRFDPSRNKSLKGSDLFRIILSLKNDDNEGYKFVNPRVNLGEEKDEFFNDQLPKDRILFRILSARFKEKVEMMDLGRYKGVVYDSYATQSSWLFNPTKKNHNMLLELSGLLAKAVNTNADPEVLVPKIGRIYNEAKGLNMAESTAKTLVEQFLLDGRFALYAGVSDSRYQDTYESIAKIIGIEPTSAKSQLLQNLANIYSKNLFTQKNTNLGLAIDTYAPTAIKLAETLDKNEIEKKDNFDIAIYAFNILTKMEEKPLQLSASTMLDGSTYSYFTTFFRASNAYISSIEDEEKKQDAIMGFSRQFYDTILAMIVNSLYQTFLVDEEGAIYVHPNYREGLKVTLSSEIINNIALLNDAISIITPSIESLWEPSGKNDTFANVRIQDNIARLKVLTEIISPENYKEYVKSPYQTNTGMTYPFPLLDTETNTFKRVDPEKINIAKNTELITIDPRIKALKEIWPDASASSWLIDGDRIRIINAPYVISRRNGQNSELKISAEFYLSAFSDTVITYNNYPIRIITGNPVKIQSYYRLLSNIHFFLDLLDDQIENANGRELGDITIFPDKNPARILIDESSYEVVLSEE